MNRLLLTAVSSLAFLSPAHATLQIAANFGGSTFFCADNAACDLNPAVGVMQLGDVSIGGVEINGSIQASGRGPDFLNTSSLSVINGSGHAVPYDVTVGDTGYFPTVTSVAFSGAGTWQTAIGSTANMSWWADALNGQGAAFAGDTPGIEVGALSSTAAHIVDSFALTGSDPFFASAPFSMTEDVSGVVTDGGQLINRGQTMIAVPEASTWAMMLVGFAGLGFGAWMRKRVREAIA
jgi:hypothetical protein